MQTERYSLDLTESLTALLTSHRAQPRARSGKQLAQADVPSASLVLQSHLEGSSRGQEQSLRRKQYLQDASPQALFYPALIATGHRRPRPKALGQFAPTRTGPGHPQHAFYDQAMIGSRAARLRFLWREERTQVLPVGIGEHRQTSHLRGSGQLARHGRSLTRAAHLVEVPGLGLMPAPEAGPVQPPALFFLRLAHHLQQATHLWHAQCDPLEGCSTFFSSSRACPCITTRAA